GPKVLPDHVRLKPRCPGEVLGGEGFPGTEEGRFHDRPRVHGTASGVPIGFGPRTGIASSSSIGRSTSQERRFTKSSPYGQSISSIRVTARRPSWWIASVRGVAVPARTTWL